MMGFVIAMAGIKLGERKSTAQMSFGYHRAELVGTLVSVVSIWIMTIWLLVAATALLHAPTGARKSYVYRRCHRPFLQHHPDQDSPWW